MGQYTLHKYFASRRRERVVPKGANFLHLPYDIRHRIYRYAGLVDGVVIYLNYLAPGRGDMYQQTCLFFDLEKIPPADLSKYNQSLSHFLDGPVPFPDTHLDRRCRCVPKPEEYTIIAVDQQCECRPLPSQLLSVSRTVSNEAECLFYSRNYFSVCRSDLGGLSGLRSLSHKALTWITSLSIRLNVCECPVELCVCSLGWLRYRSHIHCHPACKLWGHERPLTIPVTKLEKSAMAEWKELCSLITTFIEPHRLRLCLICDVADIETAKEVISPLMQIPILRECAIRLGLAPNQDSLQELARMTAICLTARSAESLQPPFRFLDLPVEIQHQILEYTDLISPNDLIECSPYPNCKRREFCRRGTWPFSRCCEQCSDAMEACCCWTQHTAVSTTCICWRVPYSLFMVCSDIRKQAIEIFYSRNHFTMLPIVPKGRTEFELFHYLTPFPVYARQYLRSITWIVPTLDFKKHSLYEWEEVFGICAREMNLSQLSFTINMFVEEREYMWEEDKLAERELAAGICIAEIMAHYVGWKNVYFQLTRPDTRELRGKREALIEQRVMGENYNSVSCGKLARRHRWNGYNCDRDCEVCEEF